LVEAITQAFQTGIDAGGLDEYLCDDDLTCLLLTFILASINVTTSVVLYSAVSLMVTLLAARCWRSGGSTSGGSQSFQDVEIAFPIPLLPLDNEPVEIEQQLPLAGGGEEGTIFDTDSSCGRW